MQCRNGNEDSLWDPAVGLWWRPGAGHTLHPEERVWTIRWTWPGRDWHVRIDPLAAEPLMQLGSFLTTPEER